MSIMTIREIVKQLVWLHTPAKVKKMSVDKWLGEMDEMAGRVGLTLTDDDKRIALRIAQVLIQQ